MNRDDVVKLFNQNDELNVEFLKSDGSLRMMRCTTKMDLIPEANRPKSNPDKERKQNLDVYNVWDLDKNAWRSFRIDSVITFSQVF